MRIHCIQHVAHEGPATIGAWASERGHELIVHRLFAAETPPGPEQGDALVVMGGPMGVHDETEHAWLAPEKRVIADWLASGKRMLGVCLGAQLIAHVLGAPVTRNHTQEIGFFPIRLLPRAESTLLGQVLPPRLEVFHWHGDTFAIPDGAIAAAGSEACANQAFVYRERVVGLQFHLEVDLATAEAFIANSGDELVPSAWVQSGPEMLADPERFAALRPWMFSLLDAWAAA